MYVERRSVLRGAGAVLGSAGVLGAGGAGIAAGGEDDSDPGLYDWQFLSGDGLKVGYLDGYRSAAETTLETYEWARNAVDEEYPHELSYTLRVYAVPSKEISYREFRIRGGATARVGPTEGYIRMLTPDWFGPCGELGPNIEHPKRSPFVQTAIHEYSHAPFYQHLYGKEEGYSDQPRWLSQGIGDYIARNYRPAYIDNIADAVESDTWDFEQRPYYWGLFLGEFMYDRNSPEDVVALVKSPEPSFEAAVETEFGTPHDTFVAEFKEHMRTRVEEGIEPQAQAELDECAPANNGSVGTATSTESGSGGTGSGSAGGGGGSTGGSGSVESTGDRGSVGLARVVDVLFDML